MSSIVSERIRALRLRRGQTLEALATAVGIHRAHLSRIERGGKTPSLATLKALAGALDVQMGELFGEVLSEADVVVSRSGERATVRDGAYAVQSLIPGSTARSTALYVVEPGDEFLAHDLASHGGEEILYVTAGTIELMLANKSIVLGVGDCAAYDAVLPHRLRRLNGLPATVIVVLADRRGTAPETRDVD